MPQLFTSITSAPSIQSNAFVDIPGLSLTLPPATSTMKEALVTLNVPTPYATGDNYPGIDFAVDAAGSIVGSGGFTYSEKNGGGTGRMPFTLVVKVPLSSSHTHVNAQWQSVRGSTTHIDSFASMSAVFG